MMILPPMSARALSIGILLGIGLYEKPGFAQESDYVQESCKKVNSSSAVYRVQWDVNGSLLPCEQGLEPNGLVVVIIQGANPAIARYRLETLAVRDIVSPSTHGAGTGGQLVDVTTPAAPLSPSFIAPRGGGPNIVAAAMATDTSAEAVARLNDARRARINDLKALSNAREFLKNAQSYFESIAVEPIGLLCFTDRTEIQDLKNRMDFWHVAQAATAIQRTLRQALDRVLPPVTPDELSSSQECVGRILGFSGWGGAIARGPSMAARGFAESRAHLAAFESEASAHRDALHQLSFDSFTPDEQAELINERDILLRGLADVTALVKRILEQDLTEDALTSVIESLQQSARWVEIIRASDDEAVVESSLDGTRGRSRNVVLKWSAATSEITLPEGTQTVLVDRFSGWLLNVSGSAGFAGTRKHEILRSALVNDSSGVNPDSVRLLRNSSYSWGPALSTGLSATHHWRNGFYLGAGIDLMVLTDAEGNATTRIAAPIIHLGRDDTRLFFGPILGPSDEFAFDDDDDVRIGASDDIPANLILKNKGTFLLERLYIGVIVGQSSLDPTKIGK